METRIESKEEKRKKRHRVDQRSLRAAKWSHSYANGPVLYCNSSREEKRPRHETLSARSRRRRTDFITIIHNGNAKVKASRKKNMYKSQLDLFDCKNGGQIAKGRHPRHNKSRIDKSNKSVLYQVVPVLVVMFFLFFSSILVLFQLIFLFNLPDMTPHGSNGIFSLKCISSCRVARLCTADSQQIGICPANHMLRERSNSSRQQSIYK